MSPAKFEQFSRALLTKMGVQFTSKSIQISNDGGIEAMNKYQADYGVFITNSRFTNHEIFFQLLNYTNPKVIYSSK